MKKKNIHKNGLPVEEYFDLSMESDSIFCAHMPQRCHTLDMMTVNTSQYAQQLQ